MTRRPIVRFSLLFLLPNLIFLAIAAVLDVEDMIEFGQAIVISLSVGVCVAYFPAIKDILVSGNRKIERSDLLAIGIFCAWCSLFARSVWSVIWRWYERPDWTTHIVVAYCVFLMACAAVFHLVAPGTIASHIPARRWVILGAWVAAGIMATFTAGFVLDWFATAPK